MRRSDLGRIDTPTATVHFEFYLKFGFPMTANAVSK